MSSLVWNYILGENYISRYLANNDIIELSLLSKYLRSKHIRSIYNELKLNRYFDKEEFKSWISEEVKLKDIKVPYYMRVYEDALNSGKDSKFIKSFANPFNSSENNFEQDIIKFNTKLHGYKVLLNSLIIHDIHDYYHCLNELPSIFPTLKSLQLSASTLPLSLINFLLINLVNLNSLTIKNCNLLQCRENPIKLEFPKLISKLKLTNNKLKYIENEKDPLIYIVDKGIQLEDGSIDFQSQHLPELKLLITSEDIESNQSLKEFLNSNSQAKYRVIAQS